MTLYRQLLFYSFIVLLFLFVGMWLVKLNSTKTFLIDQLESHAQDTATSLGLSISTHLRSADHAAIASMVNAIFDRGYYKYITLTDLEDKVVIERIGDVEISATPDWFIRLIPLETPVATAQIMDGWRHMGTISVESNPGYAYRTLWKSALSTALWFGLAALGIVIVGGFKLRLILNPLNLMEQQANAICNRQYITQDSLPRARELKKVVIAMNTMTMKVQSMFDEQTKIANLLRKKVYIDPITNIGNRRYIEGQVESKLRRKEQPAAGALLIVHINGLDTVNREKGYHGGDTLLLESANILKQHVETTDNYILARLTGADFALFLPSEDKYTVDEIAETISNQLQQLVPDHSHASGKMATIGGYYYYEGIPFTHLLAGADEALRMADSQGKAFHIREQDKGAKQLIPSNRSQWGKILQEALTKDNFLLYVQPVVSSSQVDNILHYEVLSRIKDQEGNEHRAGMFIPLAKRLKQIQQLDRIIIEKVITSASLHGQHWRVAVNMSPLSLDDPEFYTWLCTEIDKISRDKVITLNFEFAEYVLPHNMERIKQFSKHVQAQGHHIGIDHFGQGFLNFGYLKSLRPDYVKIDKGFTDELTDVESDSYFLISSLCNVAHSLDIKVIAEGIENEHQLEILTQIDLDAYQGYFFQKPFSLEKLA